MTRMLTCGRVGRVLLFRPGTLGGSVKQDPPYWTEGTVGCWKRVD